MMRPRRRGLPYDTTTGCPPIVPFAITFGDAAPTPFPERSAEANDFASAPMSTDSVRCVFVCSVVSRASAAVMCPVAIDREMCPENAEVVDVDLRVASARGTSASRSRRSRCRWRARERVVRGWLRALEQKLVESHRAVQAVRCSEARHEHRRRRLSASGRMTLRFCPAESMVARTESPSKSSVSRRAGHVLRTHGIRLVRRARDRAIRTQLDLVVHAHGARARARGCRR